MRSPTSLPPAHPGLASVGEAVASRRSPSALTVSSRKHVTGRRKQRGPVRRHGRTQFMRRLSEGSEKVQMSEVRSEIVSSRRGDGTHASVRTPASYPPPPAKRLRCATPSAACDPLADSPSAATGSRRSNYGISKATSTCLPWKPRAPSSPARRFLRMATFSVRSTI